MTHHFDPEFLGWRECNYCGEGHFIDDLDTDLLCNNCATAKCSRCEYTFKKSELVEDHEHGNLCQACAEEVTEERANRFVDKMQVSFIVQEIMQEL
jgi:hypothetical protein